MEQPVEQPCYCDFRLYGKKKKNALYKYSNKKHIDESVKEQHKPYLFPQKKL